MKSRSGNISRSRTFSTEEIECLIEAKRTGPWLSSRQETATVDLLLNECNNELLRKSLLKLIKNYRIFDTPDFLKKINDALSALKNKYNFPDSDSKLAIIGLKDDKNSTDGCNIPANYVRSANIFQNKPKIVSFDWSPIPEGTDPATREFIRENDRKNSIITACGSDISHIILVDDFIGTGGKILKYIRLLQKIYPEAKIAAISLIAMKTGMNRITEARKSMNFIFGSCHIVDALNGSIEFSHADLKFIEDFERDILGVKRDYIGGYKKCQCLCSINGHAVSNNVFPLFWKSKKHKESRTPLFGR